MIFRCVSLARLSLARRASERIQIENINRYVQREGIHVTLINFCWNNVIFFNILIVMVIHAIIIGSGDDDEKCLKVFCMQRNKMF